MYKWLRVCGYFEPHQELKTNKYNRVKLDQFIPFVRAKPKGIPNWEMQYENLLKYKELHGHCKYSFECITSCVILYLFWLEVKNICLYYFVGNVPTKSRSHPSLGRWVTTQRSNYKKFHGNKVIIVKEREWKRRMALLDKIEFSWSKKRGRTAVKVPKL